MAIQPPPARRVSRSTGLIARLGNPTHGYEKPLNCDQTRRALEIMQREP